MNEDFFRTDQKKCCGLCATGRESSDGKLVFCEKKGVVDRNDYCRRYKYDPLKRVPERIKISDNYNPEDFSL